MSELVSSPLVVWLLVVRGGGEFVHYVKRDARLSFDPGARALCGRRGPIDKYRRPRWTRAHAGEVCAACHSAACSRPTRVEW